MTSPIPSTKEQHLMAKQWFLQTPQPINMEEAGAIHEQWKRSGLGEVVILDAGLTVAEVVDGHLSTVPHAITPTDEQWAQFMATIRPPAPDVGVSA